MITLAATQPVPLTHGEDDVIHVTGSRVTLDSIVRTFQQGATAEQIQEDFPSLALKEVYAVIAYYLDHQTDVEEYLREREQAAGKTRDWIERQQDTGTLRARLRARLAR